MYAFPGRIVAERRKTVSDEVKLVIAFANMGTEEIVEHRVLDVHWNTVTLEIIDLLLAPARPRDSEVMFVADPGLFKDNEKFAEPLKFVELADPE